MSRREKIEAMLQNSPEDVFLNYTLAMQLSQDNETEAARSAFEKVRKLDPDYVPAYFQEGQLLARMEQPAAAREILNFGIDVAKRVNDQHALGEMTEFLASIPTD